MITVIGCIVALTSDQTIALRLLESLLILVPIWLAVTQYIIRTLDNPSQNSDGQGPREAIAVTFIYLSYLILLLSLTGIRAVLSPEIDSAILLAVIDLIILFIVVVAMILFITVIGRGSSEIFEVFGDRSDNILDTPTLSILVSIFFLVYWLVIGGLMLDFLTWVLNRIYIRW